MLILLLIIFTVPTFSQAADIHLSCEDVDWIEVSKTPPGLAMPMEGVRGSCNGKDCLLLTLHLTSKGGASFYRQAFNFDGQTPNIRIGKELIMFGVPLSSASLVPIEFYSRIGDWSAFSDTKEAIARAFAICSEKSVKYTGVIGEKN